jgi:hypothetical protein
MNDDRGLTSDRAVASMRVAERRRERVDWATRIRVRNADYPILLVPAVTRFSPGALELYDQITNGACRFFREFPIARPPPNVSAGQRVRTQTDGAVAA